MEYQEESFKDIITDVKFIVEDHYEETELYSDKIPLDPDYTHYENLYNMGVIRFFTAREGIHLKGYLVVGVSPKLHCKTHLYSVSDMIYVAPEFRKGDMAEELLKLWEKVMREEKVSVLAINFKHEMNPKNLMDHLEYDNVEVSYTKYIKEE